MRLPIADDTGDTADCARATATYRRASSVGLAADPHWGMQAALNWEGWAARREACAESAEAYAWR